MLVLTLKLAWIIQITRFFLSESSYTANALHCFSCWKMVASGSFGFCLIEYLEDQIVCDNKLVCTDGNIGAMPTYQGCVFTLLLSV